MVVAAVVRVGVGVGVIVRMYMGLGMIVRMGVGGRDACVRLELLYATGMSLPGVEAGCLLACMRNELDDCLEVLLCALGRAREGEDQRRVPHAGNGSRHSCKLGDLQRRGQHEVNQSGRMPMYQRRDRLRRDIPACKAGAPAANDEIDGIVAGPVVGPSGYGALDLENVVWNKLVLCILEAGGLFVVVEDGLERVDAAVR